MKTKILIAILTVGVFSISTIKAQEKPMNMKQDTMKMDHSKMKMVDKGKEVEIKHELMKIDSMYTCPMHAAIKSDKPGACPKCGMDLKKMETKKDSMKMNMDHSKMQMMDMKMVKAYTCPMHSDELGDKPGECSKCGRTLVTKQMNLKNNSLKSKHAKVVETYFCDMHPSEVSDNSGKCPKCGMDLKKMDIKEKDIPKKHKHQ